MIIWGKLLVDCLPGYGLQHFSLVIAFREECLGLLLGSRFWAFIGVQVDKIAGLDVELEYFEQ